jgi:glycosyltransferase involved in cell wall biosynthesis
MKSCVILQNSHRKPVSDVRVKQFGELGQNKLAHIKEIFRYDSTELWLYRQDGIAKPFLISWLLRLYSRKTPYIVSDIDGKSQPVNLPHLMRVSQRYVRNFLNVKKLLQHMRDEIARLELAAKDFTPVLDLSLPPAYLRTDLVFGMRSGGSVGHIAGVLNNLDQFSGKPIFITTDRIPTVREDIPIHFAYPTGEFSDFGLLQQMAFNTAYEAQVLPILNQQRLAFIYQRYNMNNFSGVALSQRYNVPFVLEYNGSEIWSTKHWGTGVVAHEDIALGTELLNLRAATLITVVSKPLKDQLISRGIEANKILVNPNSVDIERYHPNLDGSAVRKRYSLEGKKVIGFIGTFGAWHGAEVLAEAFGKLVQKYPQYRENVRLLMIGDGVKMSLVKKHLQDYGVMDLTILTGLVPQEQGAEHLAASDILASPHVPNADGSPFFGSPTKLFEYMAIGKGIVASDLDQIGEILTHDRTAWKVKPGDADDLVEGLKTLIDDPARADRLGKAARKLVAVEYTWREHTRKIIDALKEIVQHQKTLA